MRRASVLTLCVLLSSAARAESPAPVEEGAPAVAPPPLVPTSPRLQLANALHRFEFGDYDGVAAELESLVGDRHSLSRGDRLEALRAYGIACAVLGRTTAAEGAFLLLLESDPAATMNATLVRPEAVAIFDGVKARNRAELRAAYLKGRGRRYGVLNLLPPAGQLQNHDYKKGYALLGVEIALVALDVTSGSLLTTWEGAHHEFTGHTSAARALRPVNWVSFGALISVAVYGIIDGFVIGHRRALEERHTLDNLSSGAMATTRPPAITLALDGGVGFHF